MAIPNSFPPTVPATCVPCPLQSTCCPSPVNVPPHLARPPKSVCPVLIPVSIIYDVTPEPVNSYLYEPIGSDLVETRPRPQERLPCETQADVCKSS